MGDFDRVYGARQVGLGEHGVFDRSELDASQVPLVRGENSDGLGLGDGSLDLLFGEGGLSSDDEGVGGGSLGKGSPDVGVHVGGTKLGFANGFQGIASGATRSFIRREHNRNVFFSCKDFSSLLVFLNRLKARDFGVGLDDLSDAGLQRFRNATDGDDDTVENKSCFLGLLWGIDLSSLGDFFGGIDGGDCGRGVIVGNFRLCSLLAGLETEGE